MLPYLQPCLAAVSLFDVTVVLLYLAATAYLGWLGYRGTRTTSDYLLAGRQAHPFVMSLSYGATFISTSAIVGFGGVAGLFGMSLLWLVVFNILVGIFIAFVFLGGRTRRLGHALDAHTFPELLGRRYQSRFIQVFTGSVIALFMPLYGAAVLIGGTEFLTTTFQLPYDAALLLFAVIVAVYVFFGGLKGVMYTDALQGVIMFVGMVLLLGFTYAQVGGVVAGHHTLTGLADLVPANLTAIGHPGWTSMPEFGFGDKRYNLWWIVVSTIVLGVGIGVLAQPQLVVRFMTVKSRRELNRAVGVGAVFILAMVGVAYTTGALSNAYFALRGPIYEGRVLKRLSEAKPHALLQLMKPGGDGNWLDVVKETRPDGKSTNVLQAARAGADGRWLPVPRETNAVGVVREGAVVPAVLLAVEPKARVGPNELRQGRSISIVAAKGNPDQIIPTYITAAMPKWFGLVFLLTLLAAAMSTLSSQFHTLGTAAGRDVYQQLFGAKVGERDRTILIVRIAILVGLLVAVGIGHYARGEYIVARATAIFFGMCAAAFLPAFVGGLYWRRMTRTGALASMLVGFTATLTWVTLVKTPECTAIGLVEASLLDASPNWPVVDGVLIALPLSVLTAVVGSLLTRPPEPDHLVKCFNPQPR